jgi:replicative DNA helicase
MNKLKVYENEEEMLEISFDSAESLVCKQLFKPLNSDFTHFIYENFKDSWFKDEFKRELFKIGSAYYKKYESTPNELTINAIFKNKKYESKSSDLIKAFNKITSFKEEEYEEKHIKDLLIKFVKNRSVYFTILEQIDEIEQTGEIGDCLSRFEKIVQIDLSDDLGIEYFDNLENHCNELISVDDRTPFGYEELDKYTYGGLPSHDACLFIIMAQPGLGKSQLMMNIAYNWVMNNKKVLMISLEMSEDMYSRRMDGLFSDLNVNRLKENVGLLKSRVKGVKSNIPEGSLRIKEFPTGTFNSAMLKQFLKKLKATKNWEPDIIFVDYLNIMRPNGNNMNMGLYEKCARISEELRAISCMLKVPIVSAVQANRSHSGSGYAGADIDMSNVSESSGITATADALMALFQLEGERDLGRINLKILKNRLGGYLDKIIPFKVNYETLKMEDWVNEDEDESGVFDDFQDASDEMFSNSKTINKKELNNGNNRIEDI